jgi:hypothetical protein
VAHSNKKMQHSMASGFAMFIFGFFSILHGRQKVYFRLGTKSTKVISLDCIIFSIDRVDYSTSWIAFGFENCFHSSVCR